MGFATYGVFFEIVCSLTEVAVNINGAKIRPGTMKMSGNIDSWMMSDRGGFGGLEKV